MTPRVVVVGDAMLDVVVRPSASVAPTSDTPSRVRVGRGGAAANLAVAIASADPGLEVVYVAAVGDDAAGEIFRRELEESPVRGACSPVQAFRAACGALWARGNRTRVWETVFPCRLDPWRT